MFKQLLHKVFGVKIELIRTLYSLRIWNQNLLYLQANYSYSIGDGRQFYN